jgi:lipoic acid synthetase
MSKSPPLPAWIRPALRKRPYLEQLAPRLRTLGVSTICESARCPNLGECFSRQEATFLLMGEVCTRNCGFCAVETGSPGPLDADEPRRIAAAVKEFNLKHVVLTSVTRDDLPDGGASSLIATLNEIRNLMPQTSVELLISDLQGDLAAVRSIVQAKPDVFAHNIETVPRLYPVVRPQADWKRSLGVLAAAKEFCSQLLTKSGLMVGLGESRQEVLEALAQLRQAGVDIITIGQYLQPTREHLPVKEYLPPQAYEEFKAAGSRMGFRAALAGALVRSSYHAGQAMQIGADATKQTK